MTVTLRPTDRATELADLDRRHLIHPNKRADRDGRCVIVRGHGAYLWDAEGNELLDLTGGLWLSQVGHSRRELVEAISQQTATLEYFTSFWEFSNDKAVLLAQRLCGLAPDGFGRVFYTSGGSDGNDVAIKAARLFHHRRGETERTWILSRKGGYHGATIGAGSATGFDLMHEGVGPILSHVHHLTPPWPYRSELYHGQDPTDFLIAELEATIDQIGGHRIAAMIGEPVIGAGGVLCPPADYWPRVREVLRRHSILLIADEVVTAYGRIGTWFDSPTKGMDPDIIVTAKGITSGYVPLGAVLMRDEIGDVVASGVGFVHGYTYFGHPVACAVALANLDIMARDGLLPRALRIGELLRGGLAAGSELPVVGEIRGEGAMVGIELVHDKATREAMNPLAVEAVANELRRRHGVIVRDMGHIVVMAPPLILTDEEARRGVSAVLEVLARLDPDGTLR